MPGTVNSRESNTSEDRTADGGNHTPRGRATPNHIIAALLLEKFIKSEWIKDLWGYPLSHMVQEDATDNRKSSEDFEYECRGVTQLRRFASK